MVALVRRHQNPRACGKNPPGDRVAKPATLATRCARATPPTGSWSIVLGPGIGVHNAVPRSAPPAEPLHKDSRECRQVFELPAIRLEIIEHRAQRLRCGQCGRAVTAAFPQGVAAPVQYGERLQAAALYLGARQLIPYQRLAEVLADLFGAPLSVGTLANFIKRGSAKATEAMVPVREALIQAPVAHADEWSGAT
jgi:transposase